MDRYMGTNWRIGGISGLRASLIAEACGFGKYFVWKFEYLI